MDEEQVLARITDLERRLDWLYRANGYGALSSGPSGHGPAVGVEPLTAEILDLLRQGRKLEAIKTYRERTGVGLKEAKDAVGRLG